MDSQALSTAIKDGQLEKVQELVGSGDLGSPSELLCGGNLLCDAVEARQLDIIKFLLDKGANVNIQRKDGFNRDPPLITAVRKRDTEIVQILLDKGANIEVKSQWGATSLCDAITLGNIDMVKVLLDNNANMYNPVFSYCSALDHASKCEKPKIMELLISRGAALGRISRFTSSDSSDGSSIEDSRSYDDSSNDESEDNEDDVHSKPLYVAIQRGYVHLVEYYVKHGKNVNSKCNLTRKKKDYTPLHFACERHKKEVLEVLLKNGADINAKAGDNYTPLHIAVLRENSEYVELLLVYGANVDAEDTSSRTPLYLAVDNGDVRTIKTILKYRPNITNDSNKSCLKVIICDYLEDDCEDIIRELLMYGFTSKTVNTDEEMLHGAVLKGYLHFVDDFLKGTDVNSALKDTLDENDGYTLLHTACEFNRIAMIKYFLAEGADINVRGETGLTSLHVAARSGHSEVVELLLSRGANVDDQDEDGRTALYFAAESGSVDIVRNILKCRPRIDNKDMENPLCGAVICDYEERQTIIEELFRYGFTITADDVDDYTFLHHAVMKGDLNIVKSLLKYIPKDELSYYEDAKDRTPLHHAATNRQLEIIELLIEHGADVNARDFEGATPICSLIYGTARDIDKEYFVSEELGNMQRKCMEILELLMRHGADPTIKGSKGKTVLHYAAACDTEMEQIAKVFLKKGIDVRIASDDGSTPLSIATYKGNRELSMLFLEHGGINFCNKMDRKALHYVNEMLGEEEYHQYFSIALGQHLADIDAFDDQGTTTLQFAFEGRYEELIRYLLEYGADVNVGPKDWLDEIDYYYSESAIIIKNQILKLSIAGLKVPVDSFLLQDYELLDSEECRQEFKRMTEEKIADTTVCYRDLLTSDLEQLAAYAENESILSTVKSSECERSFPSFYSLIKGFLWRGIVRRGLLQKSIEILQCDCDLPELPDICVKKIFTYLTSQDLRGFIRSRNESH